MTLYKVSITPKSSFVTPLRGDTLFGQICWALSYKFGKNELENLLSSYNEKPFLIVSDAFASGYLPKPSIPSQNLGENIDEKKQNRKKIWLSLKDLQNANFANAKTNDEIGIKAKPNLVMRNSINRLNFTTGDDFAPYGVQEFNLDKSDIYFLIDESKFGLEKLKTALNLVAQMGYGKKASIGKGRFECGEFEKISGFCEFGEANTDKQDAFMTLSPCVLDGEFKHCFYEPFTRFGKHGADWANANPFKKPILMIDCGAVLVANESESIKAKGFVGKAIKGISSHKNTVSQGYAIVVATKIYKGGEND